MNHIRISAISDQGIQRDSNEDMISINGEFVRNGSLSKEIPVPDDGIVYVLIADGMGGHEKGEYASEYTLHQIKNNISGAFNFEKQFPEMVEWIGNDLNRKAQAENQERPMGCTLTGIVWFRGKVWIVNAGDSRTYRYRSGILKQLTEDEDLNHKYGQDMGAEGLALYNCIGGGCNSQITLQDFTDKVLNGDRFVICSDGVSDMISDDTLESMINNENSTMDIVNTANSNGGVDNISVIDVQIIDKDDAVEEKVEVIESSADPKEIVNPLDNTNNSAEAEVCHKSNILSRISVFFKGTLRRS